MDRVDFGIGSDLPGFDFVRTSDTRSFNLYLGKCSSYNVVIDNHIHDTLSERFLDAGSTSSLGILQTHALGQ